MRRPCARPRRRGLAGNVDTAIPLYDRALQANPQGIEAKLGLGQALLTIGAGDEAAAQFRDVLARHGDNSTARRGLASALIAMGQPTLAEQQIDEALRANANDYHALNLLGVVLDMQGRHAEAQANYRRGLELAPDDPGLRSNYGLSLAITGQPQEAIASSCRWRAPQRDAAHPPEPRLCLCHGRRSQQFFTALPARHGRGFAQRQLGYLRAAAFAAARVAQRRVPAQPDVRCRRTPTVAPASAGL